MFKYRPWMLLLLTMSLAGFDRPDLQAAEPKRPNILFIYADDQFL